jgi:hypothetical protein
MALPTALGTAISVTQVSTANKSKSTLTDPELDLLAHMEQGYQLETDSLGGNPVLRRLKDDEVIRPVSLNRNTIKAWADQSNEGAGLLSCGV